MDASAEQRLSVRRWQTEWIFLISLVTDMVDMLNSKIFFFFYMALEQNMVSNSQVLFYVVLEQKQFPTLKCFFHVALKQCIVSNSQVLFHAALELSMVSNSQVLNFLPMTRAYMSGTLGSVVTAAFTGSMLHQWVTFTLCTNMPGHVSDCLLTMNQQSKGKNLQNFT